MLSTSTTVDSPVGNVITTINATIGGPTIPSNGGTMQGLLPSPSTTQRRGQEICKNYIRSVPCNWTNCTFYHDDVAREEWASKHPRNRKPKRVFSGVRKISPNSVQAQVASVEKSSEGQPAVQKNYIQKPQDHLPVATTVSPSTTHTVAPQINNSIPPHMHRISDSSDESQSSSTKSFLNEKMSFEDWNKERVVIATSLAPKIDENTVKSGGQRAEGLPTSKIDKTPVTTTQNAPLGEKPVNLSMTRNNRTHEEAFSLKVTGSEFANDLSVKKSRFFQFQDVRLEGQESHATVAKFGNATLVSLSATNKYETSTKSQATQLKFTSSREIKTTPFISADIPYVKKSRFFHNVGTCHENPSFGDKTKVAINAPVVSPELIQKPQDILTAESPINAGPKIVAAVPSSMEVQESQGVHLEKPSSANAVEASPTVAAVVAALKSSEVEQKSEDIPIEKQASLKHRTTESMSSPSSESSRALRKSQDIGYRVLGFLHRRANSASSPAPLGKGHPAYDGDAEHPRVCLPTPGYRRVDSKPTLQSLDQNHLAFETTDIPRVSLLTHPTEGNTVAAPTIKNHHRSQNSVDAWRNASSIIASSDMAQPDALVTPEKDVVPLQVKYKFTYVFRSATEGTYGSNVSIDTPLQTAVSPAPVPVVKSISEATTAVELAVQHTTTINQQSSENTILELAAKPIENFSGPQVDQEHTEHIARTPVNVNHKQAFTCKNFTRGFRCFGRRECKYYHDKALRDVTMLNPCVDYLNDLSCRNGKSCTFYHDSTLREEKRKEKLLSNSTSVITKPGEVINQTPICKSLNNSNPIQSMPLTPGAHPVEVSGGIAGEATKAQDKQVLVANTGTVIDNIAGPICHSFIFHMTCRHGIPCRFRHDEELRARVRRDTCINFSLGLPCNRIVCGFYHDHELRNIMEKGDSPRRHVSTVHKVATKPISEPGQQKADRITNNPQSPQSPWRVACVSAWNNFTAHVAEHDEAADKLEAARRGLDNELAQEQSHMMDTYRDTSGSVTTVTYDADGALISHENQPEEKPQMASNVTLQISVAEASAPKIVERGCDVSSPMASNVILHTPIAKASAPKVVERGCDVSSPMANDQKPLLSANLITVNTRNGVTSGKSGNLSPATGNRVKRFEPPFCAFFHGKSYTCKYGDECDQRHDLELQRLYKSRDPRFMSTKSNDQNTNTRDWPKNSYNLGGWSLSIVPMALPSKAKGKFVWFPLLPGELRLKIWEYILSIPYSPIVRQFFRNDHSYRNATAKYVNISRSPVALRICHESRVEGLKYYTLCLGSGSSPPRTFFNYETSYLYLCTHLSGYFRPMMNGLLHCDLNGIRNLTLKARDWAGNDAIVFSEAIWRFPNLRNLQMLVSSRVEDEYLRASVVEKEIRWTILCDSPPGYKMPRVSVLTLPGLEADSDPAEYAPSVTRGERLADTWCEMEIKKLFSSAV